MDVMRLLGVLCVIIMGTNLLMGLLQYPIGQLKIREGVLYIINTHKKNQLFVCNPSMDYESVLCCQFEPSHVSVLSDGSGFSFVDNDLLYIKQYIIRSPRLVEFPLNIYGLGDVHWIDTDRGYFSAMFGHRIGIFELSIAHNDTVVPLVWNKNSDCYAPCKGISYLFYAEQIAGGGKDSQFIVMRCLYSAPCDYKEPIFISHNALLHIDAVCDDELFFVTGYLQENDELYVHCSYYHAVKDTFAWNTQKLFDFLLTQEALDQIKGECTYSFLPLMPRKINDIIVFVSAEQQTLRLFLYDCTTMQIKAMKSDESFDQAFVPMFINDRFYYGGITKS